ncbi:hypothetical protein [Kingella sp. (in: b-proteobacteria)]|uniref:hypothetical protein n=1 Tax=Kingella sp. (in: b-proteobacteria) TaxID=2020713 RepID=UPI0026DAC5C8|nr:hypothetical protein [Kingella sp. (in: b-proteobacteria)]MDO4657782.1 hypothetical protein [Kingella sp. (in: b-proteobacteria)]
MTTPTPPQPETPQPQTATSAAAQKKRKTIVIWLRVIALLFAGFFLLSQCGMSKPKAKAAIVESCIQNVPHAPKWQQDLAKRSLKDPDGALVAQYCVCMWDEPLQKLSAQQIQSFAKISPTQQLELLGGAEAFNHRDAQCIANLGAKK